MINKVGKYKDTEKYIPDLKRLVLTMQKIVEEILSMSLSAEKLEYHEVDMRVFIEDIFSEYSVMIDEKMLSICFTGEVSISTNPIILHKIIDNLISNAINYSESNSKIDVIIENHRLRIINYGVKIPDEIMNHIFEPFVSDSGRESGSGLGLYLSKYYSKSLNYELKIENIGNGVSVELAF